MDNRAKLALVAVSLMLLSGIAVYAIYQIAPLDPLSQFRTADGHLTFPGGALTADLQRLLFPGPAPKDYTVWTPVRSAYPTLAIQGVKYDLPVAAHVPQPIKPLGTDSIKVFLDALARIPKDILSFFTQDASAACTGGACFWIGGTGNFSDSTHWSLLTGGVTCVCTPGSTDSVTFDASSGAGTATQNNATFTSGAVVMTNSSVTVSGSSNTWKVGGSWSDANTHFSASTSTVEFTATGTLTVPDTNGGVYFYNLTISAGTISVAETGASNRIFAVSQAFTVSGGTLQDNGSSATIFLLNNGGSTTFFTYSGGSISATAIGKLALDFDNSAGTAPNIQFPGGTYTHVNITFESRNGTNATYTLTSGINTTDGNIGFGYDSPVTLDTGTFNMTIGQFTTSVDNGSISHLNSTSGTWSIQGLTTSAKQNWYWTAGSITVTDSGGCGGGCAYRNGSNLNTWDGSNATFIHTGSGGVFRPGDFTTAIEWGTIQLKTSSGGVTYTLENNGARWGALTMNAFNGTPTLNTGNFNMRLTSYGPNVGAGTLTAGSSTITMNGNFNASVGTFTFGTSTLKFSASATLTTTAGSGDATMYALTIDLGVTVTIGTRTGAGGVVTVNGTLNYNGQGFDIRNGLTTPYVFGGSASQTGGGILSWLEDGASNTVTIPGRTDWQTWRFEPVSNNVLFELGGTTTLVTMDFLIINTGSTLNTKNFALTITGAISTTVNGVFGILAGSSTVSVANDVTLGASIYFNLGTSQWTIGNATSGVWTNNSTSASWNATGNSTITFRKAQGNNNFTFGTAANFVGGVEFHNVTFDPNASIASFSDRPATHAVVAGGALTIQNSGVSGTITLDNSFNNLGMTVGSVTIGTRGGLTMGSATATVSGNWDSSAGTFTKGTSTVVLAATGTLATSDTNGTAFYSLTINSSVVTTMSTSTIFRDGGTVAINGTIALNGKTIDSVDDHITIGGSGAITGTGIVLYEGITGAGTTLPAFNDTSMTLQLKPVVGATTYTMGGAISIGTLTMVNQGANPTLTTSGTSYSITVGSGGVSVGSGATLTANASTITTSGNWDSSAGTFTPGTSLVILTGTGKTVQTTFYDLEVSGTVTALAPLTVTHDLTIDTGKSLDLAGLAFTLGHNLTDSGSLLNVTNTTLNGSSTQTITGTENIHLGTMTVSGAEKDFTSDFTTANVTKSGGSNVTMAMSPGVIWSVPDDTHLEGGGPTSYLVLRSGAPGSAWLFHPGASTNGAYVDVQDSTANFPVVCTYFCVDSGRNFDWVFTSGGGGGGGAGQGTGTTQGFVLAAPSVSDLVLWTEIALVAIVLVGLAGIFIFKPQGKTKKWAWIIVGVAALVLLLIYFAPMFFTFG